MTSTGNGVPFILPLIQTKALGNPRELVWSIEIRICGCEGSLNVPKHIQCTQKDAFMRTTVWDCVLREHNESMIWSVLVM